jgi:hypothetical protein
MAQASYKDRNLLAVIGDEVRILIIIELLSP